MFLFGITGYSGSGKTTLNEKVVECLRALGYSVSCVKDAHHQVDLDTREGYVPVPGVGRRAGDPQDA